MSEFKVGDGAWVLCQVIEPGEEMIKVTGSGYENWFLARKCDCRPVEPSPKEPTPGQKLAERTMKAIWAANDSVSGTPVVKESLTTEPNSPRIPDSSSEPWTPKVGERVRLIETGDIYEIESYSETYAQYSMQGWPGSCVNLEDIAPVNCPEIPDSSSDPLAPSPCMDGVDADQFVEGIMETRGRTDDFQVGDAVRFINPTHNRHGMKGILKSIHYGPKNAYLFVSDCGQFHRYCTAEELKRADQADPIDVNSSMSSLDGADTIQAGDLHWTDRDGRYRLCNFTIGMRVHDAIQRGKAHGEKWVFYRKFREVGE